MVLVRRRVVGTESGARAPAVAAVIAGGAKEATVAEATHSTKTVEGADINKGELHVEERRGKGNKGE